ncbi:MAG TPA: hypothetical protein VJL08_05695 [Dehalococcoidia bacterium]|nr:hypothetical protein [Dehalococcoidia bacterium]
MGRQDDLGADRLSSSGMDQAEQAMAQLSSETAALTARGKVDANLDNQRNELLWKITAQIDETKVSLEQLVETEKKMKKHLGQLQQLKKILAQ